jgi:putative hemolysin
VVRIIFDSAHGGFGDREGQIVTQAITPHTMEVLVSDGMVISAVTDGQWDEMNDQFVLKSPDEQIGFPQLNQPIGLAVNQSAFIESEGLQIILEAIEDSRCPADATCIRSGEAKITVRLVHNEEEIGELVLVFVGNDDKARVAGDYALRVIGVVPYPLSSMPADISDYVVTLTVSKLASLSPVQQMASGVMPEDVICAEELVLVHKISRNDAACVSEITAQKLADRGWSVSDSSKKQMANPASTHCFENGGRLEMRQSEDGVFGMCIFPDGSECEEWQYFRGECSPKPES